VIPAPITSEVDHLLGRCLERCAPLAFLDGPAAARFVVACLDTEDHRVVVDLERRYEDLDAGFADRQPMVNRWSTSWHRASGMPSPWSPRRSIA
jgi:hypothetical protein